VCFRDRGEGPEFLLVRTSDGARWTFPKGRRERGETLAQTAAREAAEEAGAAGTTDPRGLTTYRHAPARDPADADDRVAAFLLEVSRERRPSERDRDPTWFSAADARARLAESRAALYGDELARVVAAASDALADPGGPPG